MVYNDKGEVTQFGLWKVPVTPGQSPPGDVSYVSERCAKPVLPGGPRYRGLPPPRPIDKQAPPAWSKKHFTAPDLARLDKMVGDLMSSKCPYLVHGCEHGSGHTAAVLSGLQPGSLGTCALIALGDVLHRRPYGKEIDAHDTVIRIGSPPVTEFASHTGSKTDAILNHKSSFAAGLPPAYRNVKYIFGGERARHYQGTSLVPMSMEPGMWHDLAIKLYKYTDPLITSKRKPRHTSSGLGMVLRLIASRLCTRLDLYGFSPYHNRHYYCSGESTTYHAHDHRTDHSTCRELKYTHSPALENWFYHYLMRNHPETNICVYL
eukprot:jgi/Tetstr1/437470/TSEL_026149.t1